MFKTQPKGLTLLFFTELWERFGFYALQTILVLYMSRGLQYSDNQAFLIYGTFNTFLYITPVVGGYLADRCLGYQRSILLGGILFAIGYLTCAIPGEVYFFVGLSIVTLGNGFLKPNISSIVGTLYHENDPRREGGFTLFYMGINIGSLLPPLFIGVLVDNYGWHSGFLIAALGMLIGLATFAVFRKRILPAEVPRWSKTYDHTGMLRLIRNAGLFASLIISVIIIYYLLKIPQYTTAILIVATALILGFLFYRVMKEEKETKNRLLASLILIILSMGFWAIYNQTFSSLMLYAARNMDKSFLGLPINAENTQFFNPFFIFVLSPVLSRLWMRLDKANRNPSIPAKFTLALLFIAFGFFVLAIGDEIFQYKGVVNASWLAASYFLQTIGELLISPIGLAMITMLVPKRLVGMMMGVWFFAIGGSYAISGGLATISDVHKHASAAQALMIYDHAFWIYGSMALVLFVLSWGLIPYLNRLIGYKKMHHKEI